MAAASEAARPRSTLMYSDRFIAAHLSGALSNVNSATLRHETSGPLCNRRMKPAHETRRLRLLELKDNYGTWARINALIGLSARDSTLSQIANKSLGSRTQAPKTMGADVARRLEAACNKPTGWMDADPDYDTAKKPATELAQALAAAFDTGVPPALRQSAYTALLAQIEVIAAAAVRTATELPAFAPTAQLPREEKTPHA